MARLKHAVTGVVVSVANEKLERLGSEWLPVDAADPVEEVVEPIPVPDGKIAGTDGSGNPASESEGADEAPGGEVSDETQGEGGDDVQSDDGPASEPEQPAKRSRYRK